MSVARVIFEDQEGCVGRFDEWCLGKPAIVTFFYTRCENPNKCSLTITKLTRLQNALRARGLAGRVRTLAVTYDPAYDSGPLLKAYGVSRAFVFGEDDRFVRALHGNEALHAYFSPGVQYGPSTVNRHRVEVFVLDAYGRIAVSFARLQWSVDCVLDETTALLAQHSGAKMDVFSLWRMCAPTGGYRRGHERPLSVWKTGFSLGAPLAGAILALVPRCPVCWATYLSAVGVSGMPYLAGNKWLRGLLLLLVLVNSAAVCVRAQVRVGAIRFGAVGLSIAGSSAVVVSAHLDDTTGIIVGSLILGVGALLAVTDSKMLEAEKRAQLGNS